MFNAFFADKTGFKNIVVLVVLLALVVLGGSFVMLGRYNSLVASNDKAAADYRAQALWLKKYDGNVVKEIDDLVLSPCKEAEADKVQKEQLQVFAKHGVKVVGVKKAIMSKSNNKNAVLKGVKSTVSFEGTWENISAVLNEFEKQKNLVVITDLSLNVRDGINGRLDYVVYYR